MPYCPSCSAELDATNVQNCWNCDAQFGPGSAWAPTNVATGKFISSARRRPLDVPRLTEEESATVAQAKAQDRHHSGGGRAFALAVAGLIGSVAQAPFLVAAGAACKGGCVWTDPSSTLSVIAGITAAIVVNSASIARRASPMTYAICLLLLIPSALVTGFSLLIAAASFLGSAAK